MKFHFLRFFFSRARVWRALPKRPNLLGRRVDSRQRNFSRREKKGKGSESKMEKAKSYELKWNRASAEPRGWITESGREQPRPPPQTHATAVAGDAKKKGPNGTLHDFRSSFLSFFLLVRDALWSRGGLYGCPATRMRAPDRRPKRDESLSHFLQKIIWEGQ